MRRWERCSWVLSAVTVAPFGVLLCCNAGWLPPSALTPPRVAALASSTTAGLVGVAVFVALDLRGRSRAALVAVASMGTAGLPVLAVLVYLLFPAD